MNTKILGKLGESHAQNYLRAKNYRIIETNFHARIGEIDIIAEKDHKLIFIEVKTRTSTVFGSPLEALTRTKLHRIRKSAIIYLNKNPQKIISWRIDVIGIQLDRNKKLIDLTHLKNI